jgi:hypothetical protein
MSYWKSEAEWLDWIEMGACVWRESARERASEREGERARERASEREKGGERLRARERLWP